MDNSALTVLGIAAGVINIIAFVPYIVDIVRRKTQPQRATWWIWLALNTLLFGAQWAAGATWSLGLIAGQTIVSVVIALLSLHYGYGQFTKYDTGSLVIAAIGVVLWVYTKDPKFALFILISVDALGSSLTALKAWNSPQTETLSTWAVSTMANLLGVMAIARWTLGTAIYPVYSLIANMVITFVVMFRQRSMTADE